jgi:predicted dinucleotide-binding enzyme
MKVGILGSGHMGTALADLLAAAGHDVRVSSRADVADTIAHGDVVFLAVPYKAVGEIAAAGDWQDKVVVDLTNFYAQRDGDALDPGERSSSEIVAEQLPGARVVKAFNTIWYRRLEDEARPGFDDRLAVFQAGDDLEAKTLVAGLIEEIGFAAVDSGSLAEGGRRQQPGSDIYNKPFTRAEAEAALRG